MHPLDRKIVRITAPAQRRIRAGRRPPGLARFLLLTSLAVGVLAGLAEVCLAYLLPIFSARWSVGLPNSASGVASFVAAAVVTDGVLVVAGGVFLLIPLALTRWARRSSGASTGLRVLTRAAILGGTLCYLYNGWMALLVLSSGEQQTLRQRAMVVSGTLVLLVLALLVSARLESARRRRGRVTPAAAWCAAVGVLCMVTTWSLLRNPTLPETEPDIAVSRTGPRPNVLLVTLDTLRGDYLSCYGHPWIETPTLDRLAAAGIVFDAAVSQAPSTTPSHCSIMTSVYPFEHGAENGRPMRPDLVTLADVLRAHGYETVAFTSATTTRSVNTGLQRGFDRYVDSLVWWSEIFGRDEFQHLIFFYLAGFTQATQIPGEVVSDRAVRWLRNRSGKPFFAWLHYFDPHEPYGSPLPFHDMYRGRITDGLPLAEQRERYAEDITNADFQLGRVITALEQRNLYDDTLIIVTSDHGEAFGERHAHITETGHGHYLSDVTQRVPLVIKPVGAGSVGRRISSQVELIDVAPSVLNLLRIQPPDGFRGRSFGELLDGHPSSPTERYAHAFNVVHVEQPDGAGQEVLYLQQLALRSNRWKYIARPRLGEAELFDLLRDPLERTNVAGEHPDVAGKLHARITPFWDPQRDTVEDPRQGLSPALVRELEALGYLGGANEQQ